MAKAKKKAPKPKPGAAKTPLKKSGLNISAGLEKPRNIIIFFGIVFVALMLLYKPIVFEGLDVQGSDVVSNIGNNKQILEFEKETGKNALWNPYMFAGTPVYHRDNAVTWSFDTLINTLDALIDWRIWYLLLGAVGVFLLGRFWGLNALASMMAGIGFILIPHMHALIVVGHFSKLRALMWMPWVLLTFLTLFKQRNLLSMFLFTLALALQIRTQHYQIIFYTLLLLLFVGIVPYFKMIRDKQWPAFGKFNGLFVASIVLVVLIVAQPLFVTRDYTPYSTRGGNAINLTEDVSEQDKKGVGFDYATNWSYSLAEFWNLVIPRFHGGTSDETIPVPALNNQSIPAYWGELPFTQSYEYLSVILTFLALLGIVFNWKNAAVKSLTFLTILALLLALGRHFAPLYKLFFYYVPYFDKFRVPMMILTLVSFNVCVLAAFGLTAIFRGFSGPQQQKKFYIVSGAFLALLIIPLLFGGSFSLTQPNELQNYASRFGQDQARQLMDIFREARLGVLKASAMRTLLFFIISAALLYLIVRQPAKGNIFAIGLLALVVVDLGLITTDYLKGNFVDFQQVENQVYRENEIDRIIKQDDSLYRVVPPLRRLANDSRWTYHYQSIGGYNPAKLQVIQDIISNDLVNPGNPQMPLNLNVIDMLNGKYIVAEQRYTHPQLTYLGSTSRNDLYLFRNEGVLPRAFFVGQTRVIEDGNERLRFMNSPQFIPREVALLEKPLPQAIEMPDSSHAEVTVFEPNKLVVETYSDKTALLVLSEVYYPKGWKATLETGEELEILKTNHLLRSMVVPAGQHTVTLEFHPTTYFSGVTISWIGLLITYAGLAFMLYRRYGVSKNDA